MIPPPQTAGRKVALGLQEQGPGLHFINESSGLTLHLKGKADAPTGGMISKGSWV